jgi:hypothetical protein
VIKQLFEVRFSLSNITAVDVAVNALRMRSVLFSDTLLSRNVYATQLCVPVRDA